MRVTLINDTSGHRNWGCGATSAGLRRVIERALPGAAIDLRRAEALWPADRRWLRRLRDNAVLRALSQPGPDALSAALARFGFDTARLAQARVVVLNGEGMIHDRSGYALRLVGVMALARRLGLRVVAMNQTVDAVPGGRLAEAIAAVYPTLDRVYVREPASLDNLRSLGASHASLAPDAAFLVAAPTIERSVAVCTALKLPSRFVAVTGSSSLKPRRDVACFTRFCQTLRETFDLPLVVMASTRTDRRLGEAAATKVDLRVIDDSIPWQDAVAVIARASALAGGRFHPMIFAARAGIPILPMAGNTHKNAGLAQLLDYPVPAIAWTDSEGMMAGVTRIREQTADLGAGLAKAAARRAAELETLDLGG